MNILIFWSPGPRQHQTVFWSAPPNATVGDALIFLRSHTRSFLAHSSEDWQAAIWGKPVERADLLKEGDRLELLRPLRVDPKVARRERFRQQGTKSAGLFAKRRAGSKPGY